MNLLQTGTLQLFTKMTDSYFLFSRNIHETAKNNIIYEIEIKIYLPIIEMH